MSEGSDVDRALAGLEADLRRLEAEYTMYFAGRMARPPWELRGQVVDAVRRLDRSNLANTGQRFRFETLQSRFAAAGELWDRTARAREEGRPGPQAPVTSGGAPERPMHAARIRDVSSDMPVLQELYDRLVDARRAVGQDSIPFQRFTELVRTQMEGFAQRGSPEVVFEVSVNEGKVAFTARAATASARADAADRG